MKGRTEYFARIFLGIFIATGLFILPLVLTLFFNAKSNTPYDSGLGWMMVSFFTLQGVVFSLPALVFLEMKKLRRLKHYLIAGFVCGFFVFPLYSSIVMLNHGFVGSEIDFYKALVLIGMVFSGSLILAPFGTLYAVIFWLIAIKPLNFKETP